MPDFEDPSIYNQVTVQNIDDEDFVFKVNRNQYLIRAGEVRNFPKFMVRPMLKHLIDKLLIKKEVSGKLLRNQAARDALAAQIVIEELPYEKPMVPTDTQVVEEMNKNTELDRILERNRNKIRDTQPKPILADKKTIQPKVESKQPKTEESFDGLKTFRPTRGQMMEYARDVLKIDITEKNTKKAWEGMSDTELFKELGLAAEEDLESVFKKK